MKRIRMPDAAEDGEQEGGSMPLVPAEIAFALNVDTGKPMKEGYPATAGTAPSVAR